MNQDAGRHKCLIIQEEYQDAIPMKGGANIQWRSIGILIVLFFSFIFGLIFGIKLSHLNVNAL